MSSDWNMISRDKNDTLPGLDAAAFGAALRRALQERKSVVVMRRWLGFPWPRTLIVHPETGNAKWLAWLPWRRRYSLVNLRPETQSAKPPPMQIAGNVFDLVEFIAGLRAGLQGAVYGPLLSASPNEWVPYSSDPNWSQANCPDKLLGQYIEEAESAAVVLLIRLDNPPNPQQAILAVHAPRRICRFLPSNYQPNSADVKYHDTDRRFWIVFIPLPNSPLEKCPTTGSHAIPYALFDALVAAGLTPAG